jgi:hypothetical protein
LKKDVLWEFQGIWRFLEGDLMYFVEKDVCESCCGGRGKELLGDMVIV